MANVTIAGATYSDVPAIQVPSGSGTASFYETKDVTYNLTGGATASVTPSEVVAGQGFSLKLKSPAGYNLSNVTVTMGGMDITSQVFEYDEGGGGGGPSATQHTIYFEFSDSTNTTINAWYDDSFISDAIIAAEPTTYGGKIVTLAQLDGVTWYEYDPSESWETLYDGTIYYEPDTPYPYCWISDLGSVTIPMGSVWRITFDNVEYRCTVTQTSSGNADSGLIGNPLYDSGADDGSGVPFAFYQNPWGAWSGMANVAGNTNHPVKIERLVTS